MAGGGGGVVRSKRLVIIKGKGFFVELGLVHEIGVTSESLK